MIAIIMADKNVWKLTYKIGGNSFCPELYETPLSLCFEHALCACATLCATSPRGYAALPLFRVPKVISVYSKNMSIYASIHRLAFLEF